jgi:hypothetical protein
LLLIPARCDTPTGFARVERIVRPLEFEYENRRDGDRMETIA